jgi:hypothetical protein
MLPSPELTNLQPSELFPADFAARYIYLHQNLLARICRAHGILCTLEQLRDFPSSLRSQQNGVLEAGDPQLRRHPSSDIERDDESKGAVTKLNRSQKPFSLVERGPHGGMQLPPPLS